MKCSFGISNFLEKISESQSESEVTQSCPTLCDPVDCSPPGSSVHRILQARILEWVAISFSMKRSLVFPILLFSSIFLHWPLRKAFLSLLAILWNSALKWVYLSLSTLSLAPPVFSSTCKAASGNHFAFLYFFFLRMVLIPVSWQSQKPQSIVLQALSLSDLILWIYLSLPLYNCKGLDLGHTWWSSGFCHFLQFKPKFGNKEFMIWATVTSWSYFCWLYRASPSWLQRIQSIWFWYWPSGDVLVYSLLRK